MIRDLQAQLRVMEMIDATELDKKEQTIEGISDMFALSALMPEKTRMYREFNEMKVKYQENLLHLTRIQQELDEERAAALKREKEVRSTHAHAAADSSSCSERVLAAEEKVRSVHRLREQDAEVAIKAVESATRRADVSEQRMRDIEETLRTHPVVVREGLAEKELAKILPVVLERTDAKLEAALDTERSMQEAQCELRQALRELELTRKEAGSQEGNVVRFQVEMESLQAKLAKTEADLKALKIECEAGLFFPRS